MSTLLNKFTRLIEPKLSKISFIEVRMASDFTPSPYNVWYTIPLNNVVAGENQYFDTNLYRWTPPRGFFIVYLTLGWRSTSTGHQVGGIRVNGSYKALSYLRNATTWTQDWGCLCMGKTDGSSYIEGMVNSYNAGYINDNDTRLYGISIPERYI